MGIKKLYCRCYQQGMELGLKLLPQKEPQRVEGIDSFLSIPEILEKEEKWAPMIVTGPVIGKSGFVKTLHGELSERTVLYDKVTSDPGIGQIEEMVRLYQEKQCDCIIAIGGGSNIDSAKAMAARIARPDKSLQKMAGTLKVGRETPLFIAVPTTAGTGSEATTVAVITEEALHKKFTIIDPVLLPDYAVMDASLTLSLSPELTANTGMDALCHAIEAYLNVRYKTQQTEEYCEDAIESILSYLPVAYEQGDSLEAREEMLLASYKAGIAFSRAGVGNVHAIAHAVGGLYHIPHGMACGVILPFVLEDYGAVVHQPLARLAEMAHVAMEGSNAEKAKVFLEHIKQMKEDMNLPAHLKEIQKEDITKIVTWALKEANPLYPVPVIYDKKRLEKLVLKIAGK